MLNTFPKSFRLLLRKEFRLCSKYGKELRGQFLHLKIRKIEQPELKLGLTVSKRYGKAVQRNHFKRLLREAFRLSYFKLPKNIHINVSPTPKASQATFHEIQEELCKLASITEFACECTSQNFQFHHENYEALARKPSPHA